MANEDIAAQIARDYPYLSEADQVKATEIYGTTSALMTIVTDKEVFPRQEMRAALGSQINGLRTTMISMLGQRA